MSLRVASALHALAWHWSCTCKLRATSYAFLGTVLAYITLNDSLLKNVVLASSLPQEQVGLEYSFFQT
jgi:hypothetical protein